MKKLKILVLIICSIAYINTFAGPAYNGLLTRKQSNGKILEYYLCGNEYLSWCKSTDGYTLLYGRNKDLCYAIIDSNGEMVASDITANSIENRSKEENDFLKTIQPGLFFSQFQLGKMNDINKIPPLKVTSSSNSWIGNKKFIVILVNFTDVQFHPENVVQLRHIIADSNYNENGYTGSVRDYYYDNSMGQMNIEFTVCGPYTLSNNQEYYGANSGSNTSIRAKDMVSEAVTLADSIGGIDFSQFDNNNDGFVDIVHIIFAGQGEEFGAGPNAIWSHASSLSYPYINLDNKQFYDYSCSSEIGSKNLCSGVGVICHEMGHVFGLPDMYDTDSYLSGGESLHPSVWDIMSSGTHNNQGKTPPLLNMKERELLGFANPVELTMDTTIIIPPLCDSNIAFKIDLGNNEFIMLENRNMTKWDKYTPAKGLLVWHGNDYRIDNWRNYSNHNKININPSDRGFYIEPSFGGMSNIESYSTTTYPGYKNIHYKSDFYLTDGTEISKYIDSIYYLPDSSIVLKFYNANPISNLSVTNITDNSATITGNTSYSGNIISKVMEYKKQEDNNFTTQSLTNNNFTVNLTSLIPNTTYNYRIKIVTDNGEFHSSLKSFETTSANIIYNKPYIEITNINNGGVSCSFDLKPNTVCTKYAYIVKENGFINSATATNQFISLNASYYNVSSNTNIINGYAQNLTPDTQYEIDVLAINGNDTIFIQKKFKTVKLGGTGTATVNIIPIVSTNNSITYKYEVNENTTYVSGRCIPYSNGLENDNMLNLFGITPASGIKHTVINPNKQFTWGNNLNPNTTYLLLAWAYNQNGQVGPKTYIKVTTQGNNPSTEILPTVMTGQTSNINANSGTITGTINQGTYPITAKGFEYKVENENSFTSVYVNTESLTYNLQNLCPNTKYTYRAFARVNGEVYYGEEKIFKTYCIVYDTIVYDTVVKENKGQDYNDTVINYLQSIYGCDSIVSIYTFYDYDNTIDTVISELTAEICDNESYIFNYKEITSAGTYYDTVTIDDYHVNITALTLFVYPTYNITVYDTISNKDTISNNYSDTTVYYFQTQFGCDSIITNIIFYKDLADLIDIKTQEKTIYIYPNPARDKVTIKVNGDVTIINNKGQVVKVIKEITGIKNINIFDLESGIYYVKVGNITKKLVVE